MPDTFDPDAWPGGNTGETPNNGKGNAEPNPYSGASHSRDDEDFDAFGFNDPATSGNDDDFGSFSYDFDEESAVSNPWGQQSQQSPVATSQRGGNEGNDYYADDDDPYSNLYSERDDDRGGRNNYDNDDDDDFDRFDDFEDREPNQSGGGLKRKLIGAGALLFLLLALVIGVTSLINGGDKKVAAPKTTSTTTAPATQQQEQPQQPGVAVPADKQEEAAPPAASDQPPNELTRTLGDALKGWGKFAVNGDLKEVEKFFVPNSCRYLHFKDVEAPALQAKPIGDPAYTMTMSRDDFKAIKSGDDWKISGTVTAKRAGERDQQFRWEFTMTQANADSPWQIAQVRQF